MSTPGATSDVLAILIHRVRVGDVLADCQALAWSGEPAEAAWTGDRLEDLDLGDYDCAEPRDLPTRDRGLWLLTWPWRAVPHPEYEDATTPQYGKSEWRRPTLADLVTFGALPAEATPSGPTDQPAAVRRAGGRGGKG